MKYVSVLMLVTAAALGKGLNVASIENDLQPIARQEMGGVEVRVNQIQIQRVGATTRTNSNAQLQFLCPKKTRVPPLVQLISN
jgi:hypothetical protein